MTEETDKAMRSDTRKTLGQILVSVAEYVGEDRHAVEYESQTRKRLASIKGHWFILLSIVGIQGAVIHLILYRFYLDGLAMAISEITPEHLEHIDEIVQSVGLSLGLVTTGLIIGSFTATVVLIKVLFTQPPAPQIASATDLKNVVELAQQILDKSE